MPDSLFPPDFFRRRGFWIVTILLVVQIAAFYGIPTTEFVPSPPPLKALAPTLENWRQVHESELDAETQQFLRADDTLNRTYVDGTGNDASLFVAFFKSQRAGVTPHSPKVCLPGNGWTPEDSTRVMIDLPGREPLRVNRFVVSLGEQRKLVYYWYQTAHRVFADEYVSKIYLMLDGVRHRRSDEALIRIIVPVTAANPKAADDVAERFIRSIFQPLKTQMWVYN
jgi:EpsI family protein